MKYLILCLISACAILSPLEAKAESYKITVYFDLFIMTVENSVGELVISSPVTLPRKKISLPQQGIITKIDTNPWWFPTLGVKVRFKNLYGIDLADAYPPGHKMNAMGNFKWHPLFIKAEGYYLGDSFTRFHEEVKPERIQTRDSSACIRLLKEDGLFLSRLFKDAQEVRFEFTSSGISNP